jgi:hypothetical protein
MMLRFRGCFTAFIRICESVWSARRVRTREPLDDSKAAALSGRSARNTNDHIL